MARRLKNSAAISGGNEAYKFLCLKITKKGQITLERFNERKNTFRGYSRAFRPPPGGRHGNEFDGGCRRQANTWKIDPVDCIADDGVHYRQRGADGASYVC